MITSKKLLLLLLVIVITLIEVQAQTPFEVTPGTTNNSWRLRASRPLGRLGIGLYPPNTSLPSVLYRGGIFYQLSQWSKQLLENGQGRTRDGSFLQQKQ